MTPGRWELAPPGHHPSWTLDVEAGRVRLLVGVGVGPHWETDPHVLRQVVAALVEAVAHLDGEQRAATIDGQLLPVGATAPASYPTVTTEGDPAE